MSEITQKKPKSFTKLSWTDDRSQSREHLLDQSSPVSIGRDTGNTIVLLDPKVSKWHARIHWSDGTFLIADLGSSNGTTVNGSTISSPKTLSNGDRIEIGDFILRVQATEEVTPEELKTRQLEELETSEGAPDSEQLTHILPGTMETVSEPELRTKLKFPEAVPKVAASPQEGSSQPTLSESPAEDERSTVIDTAAGSSSGTGEIRILEDSKTAMPSGEATSLRENGETETFISNPSVLAPSQTPSAPTSSEGNPPRAEPVDRFSKSFDELLENISIAQSSGNVLKTKSLKLINDIETTTDQLRLVSGMMKGFGNEAAKSGLDELMKKLKSNPNDVTLLMELSVHSELLQKFFAAYAEQAASIKKIMDKIESDLEDFKE